MDKIYYKNVYNNEIVKAIQFDGRDRDSIFRFCGPSLNCRLILKKGDYVVKTKKNKIDVFSQREFEKYFKAIKVRKITTQVNQPSDLRQRGMI
jgi:hypothetical protein